MADLISPIIGAGATLASALLGSSNSDKSLAGSYRAPYGQSVAWKDGRLAIFDPKTGSYKDYMDSYGISKIPKSVYWSLMMNQANQSFSQKMWNAQNEYNTPFNQAQRLKQAGINPYLAMQNDGNVGQAANANVPNGSVDTSSGSVDASLAASRSSLIGSVGGVLQSAFTNINQQKMVDAQSQKAKSEAKYQDIMNMFAYADMVTKIQKQISETKDVDARRRYQEILNYITDSSKEYQIDKIHSDSINSFNQNILMDDEHNLNQARIRSQKLEADLLQANLDWLPRDKAANIALVYAQAFASTASGKAAMAAAENYAADAYGKRFDNRMRDELHDVIQKSETDRYQSVSKELELLQQKYIEAKKNNDTYTMRLVADMLSKLSGSLSDFAGAYKMVKGAKKMIGK